MNELKLMKIQHVSILLSISSYQNSIKLLIALIMCVSLYYFSCHTVLQFIL